MGGLVVVGACYLDTILRCAISQKDFILTANLTTADSVPYYPPEDEKLRATNIVQRRGGNGPNTLEVLQQLIGQDNEEEPSLVLCSVLPSRSSPATQKIQSSFGRRVDLTQCLYRADHLEPASSYIIRSLASGSRTLVNYNALPEMTSTEFIAVADRLETEAIWYHFEVRSSEAVLATENLKETCHHFNLTCV
jgi:ketohexokinase